MQWTKKEEICWRWKNGQPTYTKWGKIWCASSNYIVFGFGLGLTFKKERSTQIKKEKREEFTSCLKVIICNLKIKSKTCTTCSGIQRSAAKDGCFLNHFLKKLSIIFYSTDACKFKNIYFILKLLYEIEIHVRLVSSCYPTIHVIKIWSDFCLLTKK